jgi:hypothetical protein
MTDVQGTPEPKGHGVGGFMHNTTAGMPNWVWLLVIGGGIALAIGVKYYMGKKKPAGNATTTGMTPDSGLGLAVDPTTGLPYAVEGLVPAGGTVGTGGTQGIQGPPGPKGDSGSPGINMIATVRARFSQPSVKSYDTNNPGGVPIRSSPQDLQGQNTIGFAPFGSTLAIVGGPITGTTNVLGQAAGSSVWYKLASGGYISQFDLGNIGVAPSTANHSGPSATFEQYPAWPGDSVSRTRIYG